MALTKYAPEAASIGAVLPMVAVRVWPWGIVSVDGAIWVVHPEGTDDDRMKLESSQLPVSLLVTPSVYCATPPADTIGLAGDRVTVGLAKVQAAVPNTMASELPVYQPLTVTLPLEPNPNTRSSPVRVSVTSEDRYPERSRVSFGEAP